MAQETIGSGAGVLWSTVKTSLNNMFTELYGWFAFIRITDHTTSGVNLESGVAENTIDSSANACTIAGGGNSASFQSIGATDYATISGGYDNSIAANIASTISGGAHHEISGDATHGVIGGGSYHTIDTGDYGTIGGGTTNTVSATEGTVGGGVSNVVTGRGGFVGGGSTNSVASQYSMIVGGVQNDIDSSSSYAVISGGSLSTIKLSQYSYCGAGYTLKIGTASFNCMAASIGGGHTNSIGQSAQSQYGVIAGGRLNTVDGDYGAILGGRNNDVNATYSIGLGSYSMTSIYGQKAFASGQFASAGDAQESILVIRRQTTDATVTELRPDGSSNRVLIPDNTTWLFEANIVGRRSDSTGGNAGYKIVGVITRDSGAASTSLVGSITKTVIAESDASWDVNAVADSTNGSLSVTVAGEAAKTIQWVASLKIVSTTTA